jgi:nitrate reductase assembly molybdenum cofactor insertion protein NarJ
MSRSGQIRYSSSVANSKRNEGGNINRENLKPHICVHLNVALVMALCVRACVRELAFTSVRHSAAVTASRLAEVCSCYITVFDIFNTLQKKKISMKCFSSTSTEEKEVPLYISFS